MGRRLRTSTTTVIDTELCPLDDSFIIEASGSTEQWYFDNTSQWSPNRRLTPLILTPKLSLYDQDQHQSWTRTANSPDSANDGFSTVQWYAMEWNASAVNVVSYATTESSVTDPRTIRDWMSSFPSAPGRESKIWMRLTVSVNSTVVSTSYSVVTAPYSGPSTGAYVETEITNTTDSPTADYVKVGHTLKVKKNVSYTYAVTIRCVAQYIDPRDNAFTYPVEETVLLTTNRDAEVVFPEVKIISPSAQSFNPLLDYKVENGNTVQDSFRTFEAVVANHPADMGTASNVVQYKVDGWGTERFLPDNSTEVESLAPEVNIEYPDGSVENGAQFAYRPTANGENIELSGIANITRMKGNSVVWNQKMDSPHLQRTGNNSYQTIPSTQFKAYASHKYYVGLSNWTNVNYVRERYPEVGTAFSSNSIITIATTGDCGFQWLATNGTSVDTYVNVIDLTQMFGTGREPSTVADFETWLAGNIGKKDYYPYNAGELIPVKTTGLKTVGYNLYDLNTTMAKVTSATYSSGAWACSAIDFASYACTGNDAKVWVNETGYTGQIQVYANGGTEAQGNLQIVYTDGTTTDVAFSYYGNRVTSTSGKSVSYIKYIFGTNTTQVIVAICINFAYENRPEALSYWNRVANISLTKVQGTPVGGGAKTVVFPDGLKGIGDVRDEIYVDGGRLRAIKRVGCIKLGDKNWTAALSGSIPYLQAGISDYAGVSATNVVGNLLCEKYTTVTQASRSNGTICSLGANYQRMVCVSENAYPDAATFKAAVKDVKLYYELATPITYDLDAMQTGDFVWYGMDSNHNEVLVETLPWYEEGQGTSVLTVDAMFGEDINVVLRARQNVNTDALSPSKAYAAVAWKIPDMDIHTQCDEGSAIRSATSGNYVFRPICNMAGRVLSDSVVGTHLRFNWKYRRENTTTETDAGWGDYQSGHAGELAIASSSLKNVSATRVGTMVYPYAYVLGAWTPVTGSETGSYNRPTTYKNNIQYTRTID